MEVIMKNYKEHIQHGDNLFSFDLFNQYFPVDGMQTCRIHWHDEVEWIYLESGTLSIFVDSIEYVVEENSVFCIPPKLLHYIICRKSCHYYTCIFRLDMLDFKQTDYIEREYMQPLLDLNVWFEMPIQLQDECVKTCYHEIAEAFTLEYSGYRLEIKANMLKLLAYFIRNDKLIIYAKQNNHKLESIENVFQYIEANYHEKISVETLASLVNYNTQYFTRYFKHHTGETPVEYVNRIRLDKAIDQLMDTDKTILDVSLDCGFDSCSYFIKRFTKYKSMTPYVYRKMVKDHKHFQHP